MAARRPTRWPTACSASHPELRDGHIHIGDRPGFGLDPDWAFVERYRA